MSHGLTDSSVQAVFDSIRTSLPGQQVSATFDGSTATAIKTNNTISLDLDEFGALGDYRYSIRFKISELPGVEVGKFIVVSGVTEQVIGTTTDHTGTTMLAHMGDIHA